MFFWHFIPFFVALFFFWLKAHLFILYFMITNFYSFYKKNNNLQLQARARIYWRNCRNHLENSTCGIIYQYHSTLSSEQCSWSILFINYPAKRCFVGSKFYCWAAPHPSAPFFFQKIVERFSTEVINYDSLSHASPSQLWSPTQKNKIIKSPFQVHFTISSCCY